MAKHLQEFGNHLISRDPHVNQQLNDYHLALGTALSGVETELQQAKGVSEDLKDSARSEKQWAQVGHGKQAAIGQIDAALKIQLRGEENLRKRLREAENPTPPNDAVDRLLNHMRASEIRQELRSMTPEDRHRALQASVESGDATLIRAVEDTLIPIFNHRILGSSKERLSENVHADLHQHIKIVNHVNENAKTSARLVRGRIDTMIQKAIASGNLLPKNLPKQPGEPDYQAFKEKQSKAGEGGAS